MPDGTTPNRIEAETAKASPSKGRGSANSETPKKSHAPAGAFDLSDTQKISSDVMEAASSATTLALRAAAENLEASVNFGQARLEKCLATAKELSLAGSPTKAFEIETQHLKDAMMAYADFFTDSLGRMSRAMSDAAAARSVD